MRNLIRMYEEGKVSMNFNNFFSYLNTLAIQDDPMCINKSYLINIFHLFIKAIYQLGVCYQMGLGCNKDDEKAFKYLEKATAFQITKG